MSAGLKSLFVLCLKQMVRTRLLIVLVVFLILFELIGIKLFEVFDQFVRRTLHTDVGSLPETYSTVTVIGIMAVVGHLIAFTLGVFVVPYLHTGTRAALSFTFPVSKWLFPLVYAGALASLFFSQLILVLLLLVAFSGPEILSELQWAKLGSSLALEIIIIETLMFLLSLAAVLFGKVFAFFVGGAGTLLLWMAGAYFRATEQIEMVEETSMSFSEIIYRLFPPFGETVYNLHQMIKQPSFMHSSLWVWIGWLVVGVVLFRYFLAHPLKTSAD